MSGEVGLFVQTCVCVGGGGVCMHVCMCAASVYCGLDVFMSLNVSLTTFTITKHIDLLVESRIPQLDAFNLKPQPRKVSMISIHLFDIKCS